MNLMGFGVQNRIRNPCSNSNYYFALRRSSLLLATDKKSNIK